jgi:hypothetical protein
LPKCSRRFLLQNQITKELITMTDISNAIPIERLPGYKAGADVDDTALEANPDFKPDYISDGISFVYLCGQPVALNPEFVPTGDICINLREAVGTRDTITGEPFGRMWDRECKVHKRLSFAAHLKLQFEDVLQHITLEQAVELAILTVRPKPGAVKFMAGLVERGVTMVFITNGADAISGPVLKHFFGKVLGKIHLYANILRDGKFRGLYGEVGVAKGEVVLRLRNVQFFLGDSHGGDGPGAQAVWNDGGYVFAVGHDGESSLNEYCVENFGKERWSFLVDYTNALDLVDQQLARLGARQTI